MCIGNTMYMHCRHILINITMHAYNVSIDIVKLLYSFNHNKLKQLALIRKQNNFVMLLL